MISAKNPPIDCAAIFGSIARGDADAVSDRDILLVDGSALLLHNIQGKLSQLGWSCTGYTWRRIEKAVTSGSLFAVHLRNEALIIRDTEGQLRDLLSSWQPRSSGYGVEQSEGCALVTDLANIPRSKPGLAWALDVLAVGFRSAAVAKLANEGRHVFSFDQILRGLISMDSISHSDAEILRELRVQKSAYRARRLVDVKGFDDVRRKIDVVSRAFKLDLHVTALSEERIYERLVEKGNGPKDWYRRSRLAELAVMTMHPPDEDLPTFRRERHSVLKMLRCPNQYGGLFSEDWPRVMNKVRSLHLLTAA